MENASKALIMAGSVLIALIIIGALILMFSNLSSYQDTNVQNDREAQIVEFNSQFETYNRDDVRGTELISLCNKIIDYNSRKTGDTSDEKYEKMMIIIYGIKPAQFKYDNGNTALIKARYTEDTIESDLLFQVQKLEKKYETKYISKLVSNIYNIIEEPNEAKEILPKALSTYGSEETILNDTIKYYQYSQFKKAYFKCDDTEYDSNTGRITFMRFKFTKIGD